MLDGCSVLLTVSDESTEDEESRRADERIATVTDVGHQEVIDEYERDYDSHLFRREVEGKTVVTSHDVFSLHNARSMLEKISV